MVEADRFPRWRVFWQVWYRAEAVLGSLPMVVIVPSLTAVGAAIWAVGHPALTIRRGLVVGQRSVWSAVLNGVIGGVVVLCALAGLVFIAVWVWYRLLGVFGSGPMGALLLVIAVLAAAAAGLIAREHHLKAPATAGWAVGMGLGVPLAIGLLILLVVRWRTPATQRDEVRAARDSERKAATADRDADALWLSGQLSAGNELLASWPGKPRYNATEEIQEAYKWERQTQAGLAAKLPTHSGHFGVDVGFGPEWYSDRLVGPERGHLCRRIHRLAEINERYGRERTK